MGTGLKQEKPMTIANTEPFIADVVFKTKEYIDLVIIIDDGSYDGGTPYTLCIKETDSE